MNFPLHQDQSERAARRLLWLHAFATVAVVLAVNAVASLIWHLLAASGEPPPRGFHLTNTGVVLGLVLGGAWLEISRLADDGARIPRRLGAVPVDTVADPLHRRLQNLLEELAIAACIGVPRAYVLEDEPSINALTAGMDRNQAVVVVTRGALARLTRDELQGVLAHEISHIVNGDVRLNTRLVGMNHGLELVALFGRSMLSRVFVQAREDRIDAITAIAIVPLLAAGATLAVVGAIGELAARAIRAGIGRQREYFADAQAVAFTRQRDGLGGALRKIVGLSRAMRREAEQAGDAAPERVDPCRDAGLRHPYWENVSHLLLVGSTRSSGWFATHPPLRDRIRRLYGRPVDAIEPSELVATERREPDLPLLEFAAAAGRAGTGPAARNGTRPGDTGTRDTAAGDAADAGSLEPTASMRLVQATREPASAAALVVALIQEPGFVSPRWGEGWGVAASRHGVLRAAVSELSPRALRPLRWPLMELAAARLRPLSRPARESLLSTVREIVAADERVTLREWIYFSLLRLRLAPPRAAPRLPVLGEPVDARSVRVLFGLVARCAHVSESKADRAANAAIRLLELPPIGGSAGELTLDALERAVARTGRLPPLAKPLLVRQLVSILPPDADIEVLDFLRLLCVAIDCPPPRFGLRGAMRPGAVEDAPLDA
jgi:Zn-dependent protease with chaperone function